MSLNQAGSQALPARTCAPPALPCPCSPARPQAKVIADVGRAEVAAAEVHKAFRGLEKRHGGGRGLATLEVRGRCCCASAEAAALWTVLCSVLLRDLQANCSPACNAPADPVAGWLYRLRAASGGKGRRPIDQQVSFLLGGAAVARRAGCAMVASRRVRCSMASSVSPAAGPLAALPSVPLLAGWPTRRAQR